MDLAVGDRELVRVHNGLLAIPEKRFLQTIAARVPDWVTPDHMTTVGVVGGVLVAVGCVAAHLDPNFILIALLGLALNWFGDSLDGSLARHRGAERPRYGFFVDQAADVASHFVMLIGMGLSPFMRLDAGLIALLASLALMFYGHLRLQIDRTWTVAHHVVGPTELRLLIAVGFLLFLAGAMPTVASPIGTLSIFDCVAGVVFVAAGLTIFRQFAQDRAVLSRLEPARLKVPKEEVMTTIIAGGK